MASIKQRFSHLFADEYCHGNAYGLHYCPGWESIVISFLESLHKFRQQTGTIVKVIWMSDCGTSISVSTTKNTSPEVNRLMQELQRISAVTCCRCGNPGQLRKQIIDNNDCDYEYRTLCSTCGNDCPIVNINP